MSCQVCRTQVIIEDPKEVTDKIVDGRRHIATKCPVCGEEIQIYSKMIKK